MRFRRENGSFTARPVSPVAIFSCTSLRDPQLEPLIRKAMGTQALFRTKLLRRDEHESLETCIVHGSGSCLSTADRTMESR